MLIKVLYSRKDIQYVKLAWPIYIQSFKPISCSLYWENNKGRKTHTIRTEERQ